MVTRLPITTSLLRSICSGVVKKQLLPIVNREVQPGGPVSLSRPRMSVLRPMRIPSKRCTIARSRGNAPSGSGASTIPRASRRKSISPHSLTAISTILRNPRRSAVAPLQPENLARFAEAADTSCSARRFHSAIGRNDGPCTLLTYDSVVVISVSPAAFYDPRADSGQRGCRGALNWQLAVPLVIKRRHMGNRVPQGGMAK